MNISVFIFGHKHLTTIKMAKAKKEGKKKKSRKSILKISKMIDNNDKILSSYKNNLKKK